MKLEITKITRGGVRIQEEVCLSDYNQYVEDSIKNGLNRFEIVISVSGDPCDFARAVIDKENKFFKFEFLESDFSLKKFYYFNENLFNDYDFIKFIQNIYHQETYKCDFDRLYSIVFDYRFTTSL